MDPSLNVNFLDMMERYYGQSKEERQEDARPEVHYQVSLQHSDHAPRNEPHVDRRRRRTLLTLLCVCVSGWHHA